MPHEVDIKLTCLAENLVTSQANGPFEWKQKNKRKKFAYLNFFNVFSNLTKQRNRAIMRSIVMQNLSSKKFQIHISWFSAFIAYFNMLFQQSILKNIKNKNRHQQQKTV